MKKGFSSSVAVRIATSRRESTRDTYNSKLRLFFSWCEEKGLEPLSATLPEVANFLEFLFKERKLKPTTITVYRAAISSVHKGWRGFSVGESPELSRLIKNFFQERPSRKSLLPSWSLPLVLAKLTQHPFEPLEQCSPRLLTMKTALLIALASGRRVGDLHALSIEEGNLRWEPYGVRLIPRLNYLAKNESMVRRAKPIFIPSFSVYATEGEDLKLCPVRALKRYVKVTRNKRGDEKQLFVSYQSFKPISKDRLSKWISGCIKEAYDGAKAEDLRIYAHSTRSLSTSWALYQGASLETIIQAAFWARESTFSSFYLKDVWTAEGEFGHMVLSAARKTEKRGSNALDPIS
jgi:integrase